METGKIYHEINLDEKIDAIYKNFFIEKTTRSIKVILRLIQEDEINYIDLENEKKMLDAYFDLYSNFLNKKKGI